MMTLQHSSDHAFQALLKTLREQTCGDALAQLRTQTWEHFQERGMPNTRDEVFRYIGLRKFFHKRYVPAHINTLSREAIAAHILPECQRSVIVFVNGFFAPTLSSLEALPQVKVTSLTDAYDTFGAFLNNQWQQTLKQEQDPWALLNAALHPSGAFIYVSPRSFLQSPLQILSVIDTQDQSMLLLPRFHLFLGAGSQATVVTRQAILSGQGYALLPSCDIALEESSRLQLNQLAIVDRDDTWHAEAARFYLKRDSSLEVISIVQGGEGSRHDYRVALMGENAEAYLNGLALLSKNSEAHIHSWIDHLAPHCRSLQLFKNVLRDASRSSFEGKIYVHSEAQKTDAFQLNNNLLLSDGAQANSKPNLEIFADDVKASHGSTMGQPDEEQLFYLMARGLDRATAHHILIQGFCRPVLDKLTLSSIAKEVSRSVINYIAAT